MDGWHRVRAKRRRGAIGGREGVGEAECGRRMSLEMAAEQGGPRWGGLTGREAEAGWYRCIDVERMEDASFRCSRLGAR